MPTNYTSLANGQFATATTFNAPLTELDNAIEAMIAGTKTFTEVSINGAAGTNRILRFESATSSRFTVRVTNTAEAGSNAGSDFLITRFDDSGVAIDSPLTIFRNTGRALFAGEVEIDGALNHDGSTAGFFGVTPAARPNMGAWAGLTDAQRITALRDALNTLGLAQYS